MDMDLKGRRALVGGASQGIGLAGARVLAALGAEVVLLARDTKRLNEAVRSLPDAAGQKHGFRAVDYTAPDALATALKELGEFQILIHNTGGPPPGRAMDASPEDYRRAFDMHLVAGQILVQGVVPGMRAAKYGRIVNVISTSVYEPITGLGVSNTVRSAVAGWAKTLSEELGPDGITVNNVLPGYTRTKRLDQIIAGRAEKAGLTVPDMEKKMMTGVPLRRFAQASEIANLIAFLASPAASYISGQSVAADGGRSRSI